MTLDFKEQKLTIKLTLGKRSVRLVRYIDIVEKRMQQRDVDDWICDYETENMRYSFYSRSTAERIGIAMEMCMFDENKDEKIYLKMKTSAFIKYLLEMKEPEVLNALMDIVVSGNRDLDTLLQNEQVKENVNYSAIE